MLYAVSYVHSYIYVGILLLMFTVFLWMDGCSWLHNHTHMQHHRKQKINPSSPSNDTDGEELQTEASSQTVQCVPCTFAQWSPLVQVLMTLCALLATVLTTVAATTSGLVNVSFGFKSDYQPCILFASNEGSHIELSVNSKSCKFSFIGEIVVSGCVVLLAVWFMCKPSRGGGRKYEMPFSLLQVFMLFMVFLLATACGIIVSVGLSHTCTSRHGSTNAMKSMVGCGQLPVTFRPGGTEVELNHVGPMLVVAVMLWVSVVLALALLVTSFLIVIWQRGREPTRYVIMERVFPC